MVLNLTRTDLVTPRRRSKFSNLSKPTISITEMKYSSQPPKSNTHLTRTLRDFEKSYKNHLTRTRRFALRIFRFPTENIDKRPENATKSESETKPPKIFRLRRQKTFYSVTEILILMVLRFFWQRGQNPLNSNTHLSRTNS